MSLWNDTSPAEGESRDPWSKAQDAKEEFGMDGLSMLRQAILTIPLRAAPPPLSKDDAAVGLGFLDAALRLNHVRRVTERLTLTQHRQALLLREVEISVKMLSGIQLDAARRYQTLISGAAEDPGSQSTIWVPIARLPGYDAGPLEVRNAGGERIPRLTRYDISQLLASGLRWLLRSILSSHPDAQDPDTKLGALLNSCHQSRWLIESSILTILTEPGAPQVDSGPLLAGPREMQQNADPRRVTALNILETYGDLLADYFALLDVSINDIILVVAIDSKTDYHLLMFEAPMYVNQRRHTIRTILRASRQGYQIRYLTDIPATLRSYHLVVECPRDVYVEMIFLSSNVYEQEVRALANDLLIIADKFDRHRTPQESSATNTLRIELSDLLGRLSELLRRSSWQASAIGIPPPYRWLQTCHALVNNAASADTASMLPRVLVQEKISLNPEIYPDMLRTAAREIESNGLYYDISMEAQPASNLAIANWQRPPQPFPMGGRVSIRTHMLLHPSLESNSGIVLAYALVAAGMSYALACFATKSFWPFTPSADHAYRSLADPAAVIAVILVIPGFLSALSLPGRSSIAGHLRIAERIVAYVCIASMAMLAADLAAARPGWLTQLAFVVATAAPLASTLLLVLLHTNPSSTPLTLARLGAPRWVTSEAVGNVRPVLPAAVFSRLGDST